MDKNNIKVSVIVPVYNVENYITKCIKSIVNQDYINLEIILVDDGSQDKSGDICDEFAKKDDRIKVVHKKNSGVSSARNSGIDISTGDYVCFVDGDDYVMKDYISYMLNLAVSNDAEIAITTEMFGNFEIEQVKKDLVRIWNGEDAVEAILCYQVPIGCYCKLFKKSFIENNIRFMTEIFIGEGFNFNIDAFQMAKKVVAGYRRIYYYRRDNPASAMTKFSIKKCENGLLALEVIKNKLNMKNRRIENAWRYANWRTHTDFFDMIVLAKAQKKYPEIYRKCLKTTINDAFIAFSVPTSNMNRVRAGIMKICPHVIPFLMKLRRIRYKVKI